jgi:D-beta-D-heptose 7-phosphate kinase/D-beta-D-heptose 1-phosphate adenosyltransferase
VEKLSLELEDKLLGVISSVVRGHDVIVLSDYAKGVLTDRVIGATINAARELSIPIIVDPKSEQLERYAGATLVTPNSRELFAATGLDPALDDETAAAAGYSVLQRMDIRSLLVTRAEKGMTLITRGSDPVHISSTAREVSDVVGAGDTVIAALSLAIGAGGGLPEAASLANLAAGIVVGKRGTATVTRTELLAALAERNRFSEGIVETHLLSLQDVGSRTDLWRRDGLKIGFTNGCFDILHVGHIKLLNFARSHCDRLIVGLNSDASARRLKGPTRPINSQSDRAYLIAALNMVDAVILFDQDTPLNLIEEIKPDVLVKGADYTLQQIVGAEFVLKRGGTVLRCDLVPDRSTTKTLGEIVAGDSP